MISPYITGCDSITRCEYFPWHRRSTEPNVRVLFSLSLSFNLFFNSNASRSLFHRARTSRRSNVPVSHSSEYFNQFHVVAMQRGDTRHNNIQRCESASREYPLTPRFRVRLRRGSRQSSEIKSRSVGGPLTLRAKRDAVCGNFPRAVAARTL